jgi:hypothetical protein
VNDETGWVEINSDDEDEDDENDDDEDDNNGKNLPFNFRIIL